MSTEIEVPEEFAKVIKDFVGDLKTTFPEYNSLISKWWKDVSTFDYIENEEERNKAILAAEAEPRYSKSEALALLEADES